MPVYVYECANGHLTEKIVRKADDAPKSCPTCGAPVKQVPAVPGKFQWGKTGGWI